MLMKYDIKSVSKHAYDVVCWDVQLQYLMCLLGGADAAYYTSTFEEEEDDELK